MSTGSQPTTSVLERSVPTRLKPSRSRSGSRGAQRGPETIRALGTGVPNHSELEPSGAPSYGLGGASEAGGVSFLPAIWEKVGTRAGASA